MIGFLSLGLRSIFYDLEDGIILRLFIEERFDVSTIIIMSILMVFVVKIP